MILPARPLPLSPIAIARAHRGARLRQLAGLVVIGIVLAFAGGQALGIVEEQWVWTRGARAESADCNLHVSTVALLHHVELEVRYRAGAGRHGGPDRAISFWTVGKSVDPRGAIEVHWSGSQLATSWSVGAAPWRWLAIAVFALVGMLLAGWLFWAARRVRAGLDLLRRVAESSEEIEVVLLASEEPRFFPLLATLGAPFGLMGARAPWTVYRVRVPLSRGQPAHYRDPGVVEWSERKIRVYRGLGELLRFGPGNDRLLALRDATGRLVFVYRDLLPFQFDDATERGIRQRLSADGADATRATIART